MSNLLHIPLSSAWLCADCSAIGNYHRSCPACASDNVMPLAPVLNRKPERYEPAPGELPPVFRGALGAVELKMRREAGR